MISGKRVFIVHGWADKPNRAWFPWLKDELEERGFEVISPQMPDRNNPRIESWVPFLKSIVGNLDEKTYFVGHSIGCQAIMRYLESEGKAGGCVFVAGWLVVKGLENEGGAEEIAKPWVDTKIDFARVIKNSGKITAIFSDDDYYVFSENWKMFREKLRAKVIVEKKKGHFTQDDGVMELDIALEELLEMAK